MNQFGIHWFRRDLRIAGNSALLWNLKENKGKTLGIFFFDSTFLSRPDFSHHRFGFFLKTLRCLKQEMSDAGGDLLILDRNPELGFEFLFSKMNPKLPTHITFNRDYEPFARERDSKMIRQLETAGISVHTFRDHLLIEPHELQKDIPKGKPGSPFYQIYTPFQKKWVSLLDQEKFQERLKEQEAGIHYLEKRISRKHEDPLFSLQWDSVLSQSKTYDALEEFIQKNAPLLKIELPAAGSLAAFRVATAFRKKIDHYLDRRDIPAMDGTSHLSIYIKNGSITAPMVLKILNLENSKTTLKTSNAQFLKELVWREFYYHILYHRPSVETNAYLSQYRDLPWENRESWFKKWQEGKTGFPIVDAGMRELKSTGWMHNRVRMIVASFLTKDLLVDWKWGEKHFMNELLDGDLAPNNGGWQWAASTGCDPQPYFRVFNPLLQSKKFDPKGEYIKKFVPELGHLSPDRIHQPGQDYLPPIVVHAIQKQKALDLYKRRKTIAAQHEY